MTAPVQQQLLNVIWHGCSNARLTSSASEQLRSAEMQQVPDWSGFNAALSMSKVPPLGLGYFPVINASPTELTTGHKVLENAVDVAHQQSQEDIVVVFDQAIYAKTQEILWKTASEHSRKFCNVVVRMGGPCDRCPACCHWQAIW